MDEVKKDPEQKEESEQLVQIIRREVQLSGWRRAVTIIVGIISIVLAFIVAVNPVITLATLALILSIALFVIGIDRLAQGISGRGYKVVEVVPVKRGKPAQG